MRLASNKLPDSMGRQIAAKKAALGAWVRGTMLLPHRTEVSPSMSHLGHFRPIAYIPSGSAFTPIATEFRYRDNNCVRAAIV
jgi:hypothetical protein